MPKVKMDRTVAVDTVIKPLWRSFLACLALSLMMVGCTASSTVPESSDTSSGSVDRVEVVYFHRARRCSGCSYAEACIRHTMETYFKDELASGEVTFEVLDVEDEENATIVKKYGAFSSSLFISTIRDGIDHIEEVREIWYFLGNDEAFVEVVKSKIEKSLNETD